MVKRTSGVNQINTQIKTVRFQLHWKSEKKLPQMFGEIPAQVKQHYSCAVLHTNIDFDEEEDFYKQLLAIQKTLSKGGIAIVMDALNAKMGYDNSWWDM